MGLKDFFSRKKEEPKKDEVVQEEVKHEEIKKEEPEKAEVKEEAVKAEETATLLFSMVILTLSQYLAQPFTFHKIVFLLIRKCILSLSLPEI